MRMRMRGSIGALAAAGTLAVTAPPATAETLLDHVDATPPQSTLPEFPGRSPRLADGG